MLRIDPGHDPRRENLEPRHLVNWTRVAYNSAASVPFDDFTLISTGEPPDGPVPAYPLASNLPGAWPGDGPVPSGAPSGSAEVRDAVREQIRMLIIEELQQLIEG